MKQSTALEVMPTAEVALARLSEVAASVLEVERVSVWRFDPTRSKITCADLFERSVVRHTRGGEIGKDLAPRYFDTLATERAIVAHDARADLRTSEFTDSYLVPNGITSMLDAPVFVGGEMVGIVCNEHVGGVRRWTAWEERVLAAFADLVASVLVSTPQPAAENLFDDSPVALVLTRIDTHTVLRGNRRAIELFGVDEASVEGSRAHDFWVEPADRRRLVEAVETSGSIAELHARLKSASGREFWAELEAQRVVFEGTPAVLVGIHDRTRQRETEARLLELATRDSLTGVFNRHHFFEAGEHELARAERYERPVSLAMVDLDHFKRINDAYGHATGDRVLRLFADTCRGTLRRNDIFARIGGEEFVILFVETDRAVALSICERLRRAVEELVFPTPNGREDRFTVSIGVVERREEEPLPSMLRRADENLYKAKAAGRNCLAE